MRIDDRELDAVGCRWYDDDAIVFGVVVGGEARTYPKNVMEVQEMVNDTLGGRRIGMPYCALCGSAQAYFTDDISAAVDGWRLSRRRWWWAAGRNHGGRRDCEPSGVLIRLEPVSS